MMFRYRLVILNSVLLLALVAAQWGRRTEGATLTHADFLRGLAMPFKNWRATDGDLKPDEKVILQPDAALVRHYQDQKGDWADLAVIAGHRKRSVHTPAYCMVGGGWDILWQQPAVLTVASRQVPAMRMLMGQSGHEILVTYFFSDGDFCTRSILQYQATTLWKRLTSGPRIGALVRLIVPVGPDEGAALKETDEFAGATIPPVLGALRRAELR